MYTIKPRISRRNGMWWCSGGGYTGCSSGPYIAYLVWESARRNVAAPMYRGLPYIPDSPIHPWPTER